MSHGERVGIYGGTFDPIHFGHLAVAEEARAALELSRVLIVPAARQPLKGHSQGAAPAHRLAMARLACADNGALAVDPIEIERPPPSYTIDTIAALRKRLGAHVELWFILGADAARDLPRWHRADQIVGLARLAIVGRPGATLHLPSLETALPALAGRYSLIEGPHLDISSTALRRRLAAGRPVRYQLPESVRVYIEAQGLYADDERTSTAAG
jgi:nicotinate-nucleotide adenylyltransferase